MPHEHYRYLSDAELAAQIEEYERILAKIKAGALSKDEATSANISRKEYERALGHARAELGSREKVKGL